MLLETTAAFAQWNAEAITVPGLTIEARTPSSRLWGIVPLSANDLELDFYIDSQTGDFSTFMYRCEYLGKSGQKTGGGVIGTVARREFKPSPDGRLVAQRRETLPGGGLAGAECHVLDLRK
jgi:hypothetical protein